MGGRGRHRFPSLATFLAELYGIYLGANLTVMKKIEKKTFSPLKSQLVSFFNNGLCG